MFGFSDMKAVRDPLKILAVQDTVSKSDQPGASVASPGDLSMSDPLLVPPPPQIHVATNHL